MLDCVPREIMTLFTPSSGDKVDIEVFKSGNKILVEDTTIPIKKGDMITRKIRNGVIEDYIVIDNGFCSRTVSIPEHYQLLVKRYDDSEKDKNDLKRDTVDLPSTVIINNNGQFSRSNLNSNDNSVNNYSESSDIFNKLREISKELPDDCKQITLSNIREMEESQGKKTFNKKYNNFIQNVANHITIFSPAIPILTKMLSE